jgi:hypothetical protein
MFWNRNAKCKLSKEAGMRVVQCQRLSISEAEDVVAEIYGCLEEYNVPMPKMAFSFLGGSRVSITMRIDDPIAANMMHLRLATWFTAQKPLAHAGRDPRLKI